MWSILGISLKIKRFFYIATMAKHQQTGVFSFGEGFSVPISRISEIRYFQEYGIFCIPILQSHLHILKWQNLIF